jgi:tetratricopeptide (TPR) repeat protein
MEFSTNQLIEEATRLANDGDYVKALEIFNISNIDISNIDLLNIEIFIFYISIMNVLIEPKEVIEIIDNNIEKFIDPEKIIILTLKAKALMKMGNKEESFKLWEFCIQSNSVLLGDFILELDRLKNNDDENEKDTIEYYISIYEDFFEQIKPNISSDIYNSLYAIFLNTKAWALRDDFDKYDEATNYIDEALELSGESYIINFLDTKAYLEVRHRNYDYALELYSKCILNTDIAYYRLCRGDIYIQLGKDSLALDDYIIAKELFLKNGLNNYSIGEGIEFVKDKLDEISKIFF